MWKGVLFLTLALWADTATGQETRCYRMTHRVQVRMADGERHMGLLFGLNDTAVWLLPQGLGHIIAPGERVDPLTLPLKGIERIALDDMDAIKDGGKLGMYIGGLGGLMAGFVVIAQDGSFSTATVLLPLLGSGLGWLVGATIASFPEAVVKHRNGGTWTADERKLVHDRLPLHCDPGP